MRVSSPMPAVTSVTSAPTKSHSRATLVGEADLGRQERVGRVLDHLRRRQPRLQQRHRVSRTDVTRDLLLEDRPVRFGHPPDRRRVVAPEDDPVGVQEVLDGAPLPEELRVRHQAEQPVGMRRPARSSISDPSQYPVPIGTVLFVTMTWCRRRCRAISRPPTPWRTCPGFRSAPAGCRRRRRRCRTRPSPRPKSSVNRSDPSSSVCRRRSSRPGSWNGAWPPANCSKRLRSDSTATTVFPTWARHAATTDPT